MRPVKLLNDYFGTNEKEVAYFTYISRHKVFCFYSDNFRMTTFLLTLVRHGTTDAKRRISKAVGGHGNTLSRKGYCQADLLGQRLKCENFTHIYCSDISKAKETAIVIANHNRFCSKLPIHEDPRLEELRSLEETQQKQNLENINNSILDKLETLDDIRHRAEDFFQEICNSFTSESKHRTSNDSRKPNVLVVSHKGLIREMLRYFYSELGCPLPRRSGRRMNWNSPYTGLSVFRVTIDRTEDLHGDIHVECLMLNDNSHLDRRSNVCSMSSDSCGAMEELEVSPT